jgi:hypothetical protein
MNRDMGTKVRMYSYQWLIILTARFHNPPCRCGLRYHLKLDTAELVSILEEFYPVLFFADVPFLESEKLLTWLSTTQPEVFYVVEFCVRIEPNTRLFHFASIDD